MQICESALGYWITEIAISIAADTMQKPISSVFSSIVVMIFLCANTSAIPVTRNHNSQTSVNLQTVSPVAPTTTTTTTTTTSQQNNIISTTTTVPRPHQPRPHQQLPLGKQFRNSIMVLHTHTYICTYVVLCSWAMRSTCATRNIAWLDKRVRRHDMCIYEKVMLFARAGMTLTITFTEV